MICTEEEATGKWCPKAGYTDGMFNSAANRIGDYKNPQMCRCIASRCMMWVYADNKQEKGYCGLTGQMANNNDNSTSKEKSDGRKSGNKTNKKDSSSPQ